MLLNNENAKRIQSGFKSCNRFPQRRRTRKQERRLIHVQATLMQVHFLANFDRDIQMAKMNNPQENENISPFTSLSCDILEYPSWNDFQPPDIRE